MKTADKPEEVNIKFIKLRIRDDYGDVLKNIYYIEENGESCVMENFRNNLTEDEQDQVKDLITRMATIEDYKSPKIKYHLHGYAYGEICPKPHRFFFFQVIGNNIVFFSYALKKKDSFKDSFYRKLNKKKEHYEQEFKKFIERDRRNI